MQSYSISLLTLWSTILVKIARLFFFFLYFCWNISPIVNCTSILPSHFHSAGYMLENFYNLGSHLIRLHENILYIIFLFSRLESLAFAHEKVIPRFVFSFLIRLCHFYFRSFNSQKYKAELVVINLNWSARFISTDFLSWNTDERQIPKSLPHSDCFLWSCTEYTEQFPTTCTSWSVPTQLSVLISALKLVHLLWSSTCILLNLNGMLEQ